MSYTPKFQCIISGKKKRAAILIELQRVKNMFN